MEMSAGGGSEVHPDIPAGTVALLGVMDVDERGPRWTQGRDIAGALPWNIAFGAAAIAGTVGLHAISTVRRIADPAVGIALRPPLLPRALQPARAIEMLELRGHQERHSGGRQIERVLEILVPVLVEQLLDLIDLNALVKRHLDVEAIVAGLDLDAVVDRVDVDRVAGRLDVDAVLDRIDLTAIARERVDLDAIVAAVDIDAIASRLDVDAVLDRIDLTAIVRERVDLDAIVAAVDIDAIASRLDVEAVIDRLDLAGLAEQVIEAVNLPEIIRDSTGSMASEAVRGVRMQSIEADEAVGRVLDRVFRRRRTPPASSSSDGPRAPLDNEALPTVVQPSRRAEP
jgi:hypothetical protein